MMSKLALVILVMLSGCQTTNRLPKPHYKLHGYITTDGYTYIINPKTGDSIAIKINAVIIDDETE